MCKLRILYNTDQGIIRILVIIICLIDRLIGLPENRARLANRPQQVPALAGFFVEDVGVGSEHTLALTSTGDVWGWGSNGDGQLGLGHFNTVREPVLIGSLQGKNVQQVSYTTIVLEIHKDASIPAIHEPLS